MVKEDKKLKRLEKREDKKIIRQAGRDYKKGKKDLKLGEQISTEAGKFGIDIDSQTPPSTFGLDKKAKLDKRISDYAEKDYREGLQKFQQFRSGPGTKTPQKLDKEQLKQSLRNEKKAKFSDILTSLGRGLQGKSIDPETFRTYRIRQEREAQYKQYRDIADANKATSQKWESKEIDDQLEYLYSLRDDASTSELRKANINKIIADTEKVRADTKKIKEYSSTKAKPSYTYQTDNGNWQLTNQKNPYSDLYYKMTGNSPVIVNEVAKLAGHAVDETGSLKRNLSSDEIERFSNTLLSKAFDIQIDENGNRVAIPKPGKENLLQDLSSYISATNQHKAEIKRLRNEMNTEMYNVSGWAQGSKREEIQDKYASLISEEEGKLTESESQLKNLLSGSKNIQSGSKSNNPWDL